MASDLLTSSTRDSFSYEGVTHAVYRKGNGPAVIIIAEVPGITPKVLDFANRVAASGMAVCLPSLFGTDGKEPSLPYAAKTILRSCVSREFTLFATGSSSPVITWLKALARQEHSHHGGAGVGVVGMCLTGGFGLAMMADDSVIAPVLSQPSLPIALKKRNRSSLGLSQDERDKIAARAAAGVCVLGLKFTHDPLVPAERFAALRDLLGDNFVGVEIDSSPGNPYGHPKAAHSVLTEHLIDEPGTPTREALDQVLAFLKERVQA